MRFSVLCVLAFVCVVCLPFSRTPAIIHVVKCYLVDFFQSTKDYSHLFWYSCCHFPNARSIIPVFYSHCVALFTEHLRSFQFFCVIVFSFSLRILLHSFCVFFFSFSTWHGLFYSNYRFLLQFVICAFILLSHIIYQNI